MVSPLILFVVSGHAVTLFSAVLSFMWLVYLWETYLSYRQRTKVKETTSVPHDLVGIMDEENFKKSRLYSLDKGKFALINGMYHMIQLTLFLWFFILPWLWDKVLEHGVILNNFVSRSTGLDLGFSHESEIKSSILFFIYVSIFMFIDSFPWSVYSAFVIEARYGFNKQTFGFFVKDRIKSLILSLIIGAPVISGLVWIIKVGGPHFYVYAFLFSCSFTIFMMFIYPEFIAPLFDRYEPLPEGTLRQKIEALAASIKFPLTKLLVVEGSKRSAHSNAYFYGFGKNKRIVLYDTLIRGFKFPVKEGTEQKSEDSPSKNEERGCAVDEEVVAVLAHELGHWKLGHTLTNLFIGLANLFLMFFVFGMLMDFHEIFASFGFYGGAPIMLRLMIIFQFIFSPYNTVLDFLMTLLSRRLEFQADAFANNLGFGDYLRTALITLQKDNLSFPVCDWLYSMFNYSHPPLLERLAAIDAAKTKSK